MQVGRAPELYLWGAAAADFIALMAVSAIPEVHSNPAATTAALALLTCAAPATPPEYDSANDKQECSEAMAADKLHPPEVGNRLRVRLAQSIEVAGIVGAVPEGESDVDEVTGGVVVRAVRAGLPPGAEAAGCGATEAGERAGAIRGLGFAAEEEPWAADAAECIDALRALHSWRSPRGAPAEAAAGLWPRLRGRQHAPQHAVSAAHARLHAERALVVISAAVHATRAHGPGYAAPPCAASEPEAAFRAVDIQADMVPLMRTIKQAGLPAGALAGGCAQEVREAERVYVRTLVNAAERLLDFLVESTAEVGALEHHRATVNWLAAHTPAAAGGGPASAEAARAYLGSARAALEAALAWTPFSAVEQRGRCVGPAVPRALRIRAFLLLTFLRVRRFRELVSGVAPGGSRTWGAGRLSCDRPSIAHARLSA